MKLWNTNKMWDDWNLKKLYKGLISKGRKAVIKWQLWSNQDMQHVTCYNASKRRIACYDWTCKYGIFHVCHNQVLLNRLLAMWPVPNWNSKFSVSHPLDFRPYSQLPEQCNNGLSFSFKTLHVYSRYSNV